MPDDSTPTATAHGTFTPEEAVEFLLSTLPADGSLNSRVEAAIYALAPFADAPVDPQVLHTRQMAAALVIEYYDGRPTPEFHVVLQRAAALYRFYVTGEITEITDDPDVGTTSDSIR